MKRTVSLALATLALAGASATLAAPASARIPVLFGGQPNGCTGVYVTSVGPVKPITILEIC